MGTAAFTISFSKQLTKGDLWYNPGRMVRLVLLQQFLNILRNFLHTFRFTA
jgi:hypothetical protein